MSRHGTASGKNTCRNLAACRIHCRTTRLFPARLGPGWQRSGRACPHPVSLEREHEFSQECGVAKRGSLGSGVELQKHLLKILLYYRAERSEAHRLPVGTTSLLAWHPGHLQSPFLSISPQFRQAASNSLTLFLTHLRWKLNQQCCGIPSLDTGVSMVYMTKSARPDVWQKNI